MGRRDELQKRQSVKDGTEGGRESHKSQSLNGPQLGWWGRREEMYGLDLALDCNQDRQRKSSSISAQLTGQVEQAESTIDAHNSLANMQFRLARKMHMCLRSNFK